MYFYKISTWRETGEIWILAHEENFSSSELERTVLSVAQRAMREVVNNPLRRFDDEVIKLLCTELGFEARDPSLAVEFSAGYQLKGLHDFFRAADQEDK